MFGDRKESESVGDTNLDVWQHCPCKIVTNVLDFEFNFFFVLFHFFGVTSVFNAGTTGRQNTEDPDPPGGL